MAGNNQYRTPIFARLREHAAQKPYQFHIPGHKQGVGVHPELAAFLGENLLNADLVNIAPLDDLHNPRGIIREAQELAAEAFGADRTFFSVQGTSTAIMAMILSVCGPGEKLLVPRNAHKSVLAGILLSGAVPVFMRPEIDEAMGIAHGVPASVVRETLRNHPDARGLLVINPTYFGVASDLETLVELAHERNLPVLVDEAHGVHFHFHDGLPPSAMAAGADMAATSMHKLGGSLVQTSLLHVKGGRVDPSRVQAAISMLTSTSTSYILLASLDMARMQLATRGTELLDETLKLAVAARRELCRIPGLGLLGGERPSRLLDPTKLCMSTRGLGLSGVTAERRLRAEHRVEVEMSDLCNILCLLSLGHRRADVDALLEALWALAGEGARAPEPGPVPPCALPPLGVLDMSPREAYFSPAELVPLQEAAGRVIAESVLAYPPGIPALVPGERISGEHIDYIRQCLLGGLPMQGAEDPTFSHLKVVRKR